MESIEDRIRNPPAQQAVVQQLINRHAEMNLASDYHLSYFGMPYFSPLTKDERFRERMINERPSRSQQTTFTELLLALTNSLFGRLTTLEGSPLSRLLSNAQSSLGSNSTGQKNQLLNERFEKSLDIRK